MSDASTSDEALMQQIVRGDGYPLRELMQRHGRALLTFLYRFCSDMQLAEDLFQESFLAVWTSRDRYQSGAPFRAWLWGIAANKAREVCRNRATASRTLSLRYTEFSICRDEGVSTMAERSEQAVQVQSAVSQLPDQQRQVVVLRLWNDLSYAEIAAILNLAEATVRSHMFHALASLRLSMSRQDARS